MERTLRERLWELDLIGACERGSVKARPWGYLLCNPANPDHHDSNKALWRAAEDSEAASDEIVAFYRSHGLVPRVRLNDLSTPADAASWLAARGFACESETMWVMMWHHEQSPLPPLPPTVTIERAGPALAEAMAEIELVGTSLEGRAWKVRVLDAYLQSERVRVYLARVAGEPAATATVVQGAEAALIEDVATHPTFRGQGLATALMAQIQAEATSDLLLEVVAENAERIYRRAGFRHVGEITETQCVLPHSGHDD